MSNDYELWERVEATNGQLGGYRWLVYLASSPCIGPTFQWFDTEAEARAYLAAQDVAPPIGQRA